MISPSKTVDVAIEVCRTCSIEIIVDHGTIRHHFVPGTTFPCPASGTPFNPTQQGIDKEHSNGR
jgi:hypothetical protein